MWCKEKGYTIENIAGDGNCLYACLGKSRRLMEIRSGKSFMTMLTYYGVHICNMMLTSLNFMVSTNEPLTERNGVLSSVLFYGAKFTKLKLSKWGDSDNHYDLMHPMIQQICKGNTYTRISEIQQNDYQKHEDRKIAYRQRQTRIGQEQDKQAHTNNTEKLGPEEEGTNMRDCAARQQHEGKNRLNH
eukprot:16442068-Heterocapsa_arctica.AAC.1